MGLFGTDTTARLIREAGSTNDRLAITAIAALGKLSPNPEIAECLIAAAGGATYGKSAKADAAIAALGLIGSPLSTACLIEILSSGSLSAKGAAAALGHPRNDCAVGELLAVAFEHKWYFQVELALAALAAIGTAEAKLAVERFNRKPARMLSVLQPGSDTPERISSSSLGQIPTEDEVSTAKSHLSSINIFRFGSHERMCREIDECLVHPERAHLRELYDLLQVSDGTAASNAMGTMAGSHFGNLMVTRAAVAPAVELMRQEAPLRRQEALARLAAGDTSTLETYLLNKLQSQFDRDWALGILLLLPRLRDISPFVEAFSRNIRDDRTRLTTLKVLRQHAPGQFAILLMEHVHKEPASDVSAEAASLIKGTNVDVLEAALRLLMDERWAARRRAVEVLGALQSETARQALMSLLKIERDFEMHRAIEAALKPG